MNSKARIKCNKLSYWLVCLWRWICLCSSRLEDRPKRLTGCSSGGSRICAEIADRYRRCGWWPAGWQTANLYCSQIGLERRHISAHSVHRAGWRKGILVCLFIALRDRARVRTYVCSQHSQSGLAYGYVSAHSAHRAGWRSANTRDLKSADTGSSVGRTPAFCLSPGPAGKFRDIASILQISVLMLASSCYSSTPCCRCSNNTVK